MATVEANPERRKQFSVRFGEEELRDLYRMASEDGMAVATWIRWLAATEKKRREKERA